ncbi:MULTISPECIES: sodium:alanine symporter family protein [unclassified Okeania]|uniref:alanine/glycine:cation symporter family protein n=1 Tax=unclassified Okeania TaxID=2634635 RepID=UPI00142B2922|nr:MULTISPECIES: alanine/glycine:cation symporter family protein [unclassified Okeania]NES90268.1 alanine:cation symporter family protein [Okeania sp. SIO2B9]NET79649.1 alanine:cation symporter family protein [Okeania sp. SIO1F9]
MTVLAVTKVENTNIFSAIDGIFQKLVVILEKIIFFDIAGFPLIVLWLILGAILLTFRMGFINIRGFKHAIDIVRGKYDSPENEGEVTHFQALATAISGTVGIGNVAGVAIAIQLGGPGAVFWMTIGGLFGMTSKFTECTLGLKYRRINSDGSIAGGPMYYLSKGLANMGFRAVGQGMATLFAFFCGLSTLVGASIFQTNQSYIAVSNVIPGLSSWVYGAIVAILVAIVILGGMKRIGTVAGSLVPTMAVIYIVACLWILGINFTEILPAFGKIFTEAFSPSAVVAGGFVTTFSIGLRRSAYSNEAGLGTASIPHASAKTNEPIREGIVALLEPFIDTVIVCNMTALVIVITGVYQDSREGIDGVKMTSDAFASVFTWFPYLLAFAVFLFAFSTMIGTAYQGIISWNYLFGSQTAIIPKIIYILGVIIGANVSVGAALDFTDMMLLAMAFPNLIGCYLMSGEVASDLKNYMLRLQSGTMH